MALQFTTSYLEDALATFRMYKKMAESAIAQVTDEQLVIPLDDDENSIALIMKHLAGNFRSRWTDFLTTDGEKPQRNRDSEFVEPPATRAEIMKIWEAGWDCVFHALDPLTEADLSRTVQIRAENHSVLQAINRNLTHCSYHCGQIVMLAKHYAHDKWKPLTIPKNKSAEYIQRVASGEASQR